jgi:hypothetical protein
VWRAQVLPVVRGAWLVGQLDRTSSMHPLTIDVEKQDKTKEEAENPAYV